MFAIKNLQVNLQVESQSYPGIDTFTFVNFCKHAGLFDSSFNPEDAGRLHIASVTTIDQTDAEKQAVKLRARLNPEGIIAINDLTRF